MNCLFVFDGEEILGSTLNFIAIGDKYFLFQD